MILIDSNTMVLLVVGALEPSRISKIKVTSIFDEDDFNLLSQKIGNLSNLIVLHNIWTVSG